MSINIEHLRKLHAATTQGEWEHPGGVLLFANGEPVTEGFGEIRQAQFDAAFIAAAHNTLPKLLDEIERLRLFEKAMHCGETSIVALKGELERSQAWKAEALNMLVEWCEVYEAAGCPGELGQSKAEATRIEIERLQKLASY